MIKDQPCWCITCRPITLEDMRFVVCPDCGNKRCPKANDHRNACTNSNAVGQKGSSWEHVKPMAQPEQEPVKFEAVWDSGPTNKDYEDAMRLKRLQQLTTPPQRKPLSDEELFKLWDEDVSCDMPDTFTQFKHTARAIEAAHGIKGNNT